MAMSVNKETFIQSINKETAFNKDFFKKVYGYSMYDPVFLKRVANELIRIDKKDIIALYNQWYQEYKIQDDSLMKEVSKWYKKECDKLYQEEVKKVKQQWHKEQKKAQDWVTIFQLLNYQA